MELPRYRSHKIVEAAKVVDVTLQDDGSAVVVLEIPGAENQVYSVSPSYMVRLNEVTKDPRGGYYVRYRDGFESWSPASEFVDGYSIVT